jgi:hypothetical protein
LKNVCFTVDKTQVEQFQGLLENKEGNKHNEGKTGQNEEAKQKERRGRTKKQSKQTGKNRN